MNGHVLGIVWSAWADRWVYQSFVGNEGMRCTTRWPTISVALRRLNEGAVGVLWMRYSGESGSSPTSYIMTLVNEKVRWRRSSRDGWDPRKAPS